MAEVPANACARINTGDCSNGTDPGNTGSGETTMVPMIAGDGTATADNLANGTACLRINGGDCSTAAGTDGSTGGGGSDTTSTVAPRGIALLRARAAGTPANACARINTGDCSNGTDPGNTGSGETTMVPVIAGDGTATADNLANGTACLRINGGDCSTAAGTDGSTGGGGSDTTSTVAPRGIALLRARSGRHPGQRLCPDQHRRLQQRTDPGNTGSGETTMVPVITGDGTTTADNLANGTACLRINGGDCSTAAGTDGSTGGGGVSSDNPTLGALRSGVMDVASDVANGVMSRLLNGGDGGGGGGGGDDGGGSAGAGLGGGVSMDDGFLGVGSTDERRWRPFW